MSILDHALAAADLGFKVHPLPPLSKKPPLENWQDLATTDPVTIMEWWRTNPNRNYGISTGTDSDLAVIDVDGPEATSFWASKGFLPGAKVTTPSGADRTHHYYRTDSVEIQTNTGRHNGIHPHIDVRGEGGYVVGPGSVLPTGTYRGDLSNVPFMPDDLLAFLPEKQTWTSIERTGEKTDAASASELRQIESALQSLDALQRPWVEGAGWRSTFYRVACWFARMVNSPDYAMTEGGAWELLITHAPTDEQWGEPEAHEQWLSAQKSTAGQFADIPEEAIPNLLPLLDVLPLVPKFTTEGEEFTPLLMTFPEVNTPGSYWKARQKILLECIRAGLTDEQTATVTWNAIPTRPLQSDRNGLAVLWGELRKARATFDAEGTPLIEALPAAERPALDGNAFSRIDLLTEDEREFALKQQWWGTRYMDWAETRVSMMNRPYHTMNRWTILSLVFSDCGFIPQKRKPVGLNLFQMVLGKTTTGKTEAMDIMRSVIRACFPAGDSPDIGGDASPNALVDKLIERDGKPSWFNADEAHGLFAEMQGTTWRTGLREKWTFLYDGRVPIVLRNGKKDISGVDASTFFIMYLMGTTEGMMQVLDSEFWTSGFLARYVFSIGNDMEATPESYEEEDQEGDVIRGYEAMPKQWAAEFTTAKSKLKMLGALPRPIGMDDDARRRHVEFKRRLGSMFVGHRQYELLKPTTIRFATNVRKIASLIAMTDGRDKVTLRDELIALEQAEEWLTNIVRMVDGTTETGFARAVNDVERFIAGQKGGEVRIERVYAHFRVEKMLTDKYIGQLIAEGRVDRANTIDQSQILKIKGALAA